MKGAALAGGVLLVLAGLLRPAAAGAPGKPPAPGADPTAQPVTVECRGEPLQEVARHRLSRGGALLDVWPDVAGDRVIVFARERPLREVMDGIAGLLNYTWHRRPDVSPDAYRIHEDSPARTFEEEQRRETYEVAVEPWLARAAQERAEALATLSRQVLDTSPKSVETDLDRLISMRRPVPDPPLQLFCTLTADEWMEIMSQGVYRLSWNAMSPRQHTLLQRFVGEVGGAEKENQWLQYFGLLFYSRMKVDDPTRTYLAVGMDGGQYDATDQSDNPLPQQNRPPPPVRGRPYHPPLPPARADFQELERAPFPAGFQLAPAPVHTWPEVMGALSKALPGWSLYADQYAVSSYARRFDGDPREMSKDSLAAGLDHLCQVFGRRWWRDGKSLCFRSQYWFHDRLYDVPPPTLAAVRYSLQRRGVLDAPTLTAVSRLSSRQLEGLPAGLTLEEGLVPSRGTDQMGAQRAHAYLQILAGFNDQQKQWILSQQGLPLNGMNQQQQAQFIDAACFVQGQSEVLSVSGELGYRILESPHQVAGGAQPVYRLLLDLTCAPTAAHLTRFILYFHGDARPRASR